MWINVVYYYMEIIFAKTFNGHHDSLHYEHKLQNPAIPYPCLSDTVILQWQIHSFGKERGLLSFMAIEVSCP